MQRAEGEQVCVCHPASFQGQTGSWQCKLLFRQLARSGSPGGGPVARFFLKFSRIFGSFCQFFEVFGHARTCSDPFGPVRMHSDAFGCVRKRSEAFGSFRKFLDFCRFFEVCGHRRACPDLANRKLEVEWGQCYSRHFTQARPPSPK